MEKKKCCCVCLRSVSQFWHCHLHEPAKMLYESFLNKNFKEVLWYSACYSPFSTQYPVDIGTKPFVIKF